MTIELLNDSPQQIVKTGIDWRQFKAIQAAFDSISGVRLSYCEGELEIVGISKEQLIPSSLEALKTFRRAIART